MKFFFMSLILLVAFGGCSAKHNPNGSYERANAASEKAHDKLNRE